MARGVLLGRRLQQLRGAGTTPILTTAQLVTLLFSNSEKGFVYDANIKSSLYVSTTTATPVANPDDLVGRINDQSGNAFHIAASNKPVYKEDGGLPVVRYDGVNDTHLEGALAAFLDVFRNKAGGTLITSIKPSAVLVNSPAFWFSTGGSANSRFYLGVTPLNKFILGTRRIDAEALTKTMISTGPDIVGAWHVLYGAADWSAVGKTYMSVDFGAEEEANPGWDAGTASSNTRGLIVDISGSNNVAFLGMDLNRAVAVDRMLTVGERLAVKRWAGERVGILAP
jgi:hypothetical protein